MPVKIMSRWSGVLIREVDLESLRGADLRGAMLQGADLRGAMLQSAMLQGADLRGAMLQSADLRGAMLQGADLRGAMLQSADLQYANLRGAMLQSADLQYAMLQSADLRGAMLDTGELFEEYVGKVIPALFDSNGKTVQECIDSGAWDCHCWENCPMHWLFGISRENDAPALLVPRVRQFVTLFDGRALPKELFVK